MPDQRRPHLWIPVERVRIEALTPRGGGDTYVREDHAEHGRRLLAAFNRSLDRFADKQDLDLATELIVQIATASDRPIAKERQHLRNLGFEILSLTSEAPNIAVAKIPRVALSTLQTKLERYAHTPRHIGKSNFAAIEAIEPVAVTSKIDKSLTELATEQSVNCLVTLYASIPQKMKEEVAGRIARRLAENPRTDVTIHRFANGVVSLSASLTRSEMQMVSEQYMLVRVIEANGEVVTESSVAADPIPTIVQVDPPRCQMPVVIVDSGVNTSCSLMSGLVLRTINELPPGASGPHFAHGTFVASRVVYGDDITTVLSRRASPWCPVIDVQITGDDGIGNRVQKTLAQLADVLQRIVPQLRDEARVFNLSLGGTPVTDGNYSSLARLLDYLSRAHKVLFVISAGNVDTPCAQPPMHYLSNDARILVPAESLLSLSVGSIARYAESNSVARERELSPFSRRGPGADGALKPELAAHGGNVAFNGGNWARSPRTAVYGIGRDGSRLEYSTGTSFSAPLVAQYAARLFEAYPEATPNLVRALLCHFTTPILTPSPGAPLTPPDFCGFGEPDVDRAMFSDMASSTYLFQGEIRTNSYLYLPFHLPQAFASAADSNLKIRGTVVFDPPVSTDDSINYSLCRIAGKLRKRMSDGLRDVAIGGDEDDALFPWNPLLHFAHSFRRGYAAGEWELRLRLMTRGELAEDFAQTFSVVIELVDEKGAVDVRTAILQETDGLYTPAQLRIAA